MPILTANQSDLGETEKLQYRCRLENVRFVKRQTQA